MLRIILKTCKRVCGILSYFFFIQIAYWQAMVNPPVWVRVNGIKRCEQLPDTLIGYVPFIREHNHHPQEWFSRDASNTAGWREMSEAPASTWPKMSTYPLPSAYTGTNTKRNYDFSKWRREITFWTNLGSQEPNFLLTNSKQVDHFHQELSANGTVSTFYHFI